MRIPGVKTAKKVSRWLQARIRGGALILGYHRIDHVLENGYGVCVSEENFADHLDLLRKYTFPISLSGLVQHLEEGSLPPKSVAVTFDDGYADNLYHAKPLLEKYEIPATVFVCTGYAGREFWWDELDRLVMTSQADPQGFRLEAGGRRFQWNEPAMNPGLDRPDEKALRRRFRHTLYHFLLPLDMEDLEHAMNGIRTWAALAPAEDPVPRALSHQELLQLADGGLIDIGAHTRNHLMLPRLSLERQRQEIVSSKHDLETLLGKAVTGFAYPNGKLTKDARRIVCDTEFVYACTSLHDVVRPGSDRYGLTRFWQKDVEGDKFISGLNLWLKTR